MADRVVPEYKVYTIILDIGQDSGVVLAESHSKGVEMVGGEYDTNEILIVSPDGPLWESLAGISVLSSADASGKLILDEHGIPFSEGEIEFDIATYYEYLMPGEFYYRNR